MVSSANWPQKLAEFRYSKFICLRYEARANKMRNFDISPCEWQGMIYSGLGRDSTREALWRKFAGREHLVLRRESIFGSKGLSGSRENRHWRSMESTAFHSVHKVNFNSHWYTSCSTCTWLEPDLLPYVIHQSDVTLREKFANQLRIEVSSFFRRVLNCCSGEIVSLEIVSQSSRERMALPQIRP